MSSLVTPGQSARRLLLSFISPCTISYHKPLRLAYILSRQPVHNPRNRHFAQKVRPARPPARPSPSPSASPRLSAKGDEPPRWIFSPSDVPPIRDWTNGIEGLGATHLTPLQCMEAAQRYVSAATQHESSWRPRLETGRPSPILGAMRCLHHGIHLSQEPPANEYLSKLSILADTLQISVCLSPYSTGWESS